jgi:hypothetical protein
MSKRLNAYDIKLDLRAIGFLSGRGFSRDEPSNRSGALAPGEGMTNV